MWLKTRGEHVREEKIRQSRMPYQVSFCKDMDNHGYYEQKVKVSNLQLSRKDKPPALELPNYALGVPQPPSSFSAIAHLRIPSWSERH